MITSGFGELGEAGARHAARAGRPGSSPEHPDRRTELPGSDEQPSRHPAERHLHRHRAACRGLGRGHPVGRGRHRADGPGPGAGPGGRQPGLPGQQGRRLGERPPGRVDRRPTRQRSGALPRVVRKRAEVRSHRPSLRGGANPCSPSSVDARPAGIAPAPHTPPRLPRRQSGSTRCSRKPASSRCEDAEDLAQAALLLTREPMPRGPRVGIISNAGGMGVLAADAAATHGLRVPELSLPTQKEVAALHHRHSGHVQPRGRRSCRGSRRLRARSSSRSS